MIAPTSAFLFVKKVCKSSPFLPISVVVLPTILCQCESRAFSYGLTVNINFRISGIDCISVVLAQPENKMATANNRRLLSL